MPPATPDPALATRPKAAARRSRGPSPANAPAGHRRRACPGRPARWTVVSRMIQLCNIRRCIALGRQCAGQSPAWCSQASRPSLMATAAMMSAAAGSAHHQPSQVFRPTPSRVQTFSLLLGCHSGRVRGGQVAQSGPHHGHRLTGAGEGGGAAHRGCHLRSGCSRTNVMPAADGGFACGNRRVPGSRVAVTGMPPAACRLPSLAGFASDAGADYRLPTRVIAGCSDERNILIFIRV